MQPQHSPQLQSRPATEDRRVRSDLRLVPTPRFRRLFRSLGVVTAALVITGGYVHLCLYRHGYRTIPKIGVGFLLQVVASVIVATALLVGPRRIARVTHVSDRFAGSSTELAATLLAVGTLAAFALTRTPSGLFNFRERGLEPAPQALIALVAEAGTLLVLGAWLIADQVVRRAGHTVTNARV